MPEQLTKHPESHPARTAKWRRPVRQRSGRHCFIVRPQLKRLRRVMHWILYCALLTEPSATYPRLTFSSEVDCGHYVRTVDRDRFRCTCKQGQLQQHRGEQSFGAEWLPFQLLPHTD
jgi:hypothetical protein